MDCGDLDGKGFKKRGAACLHTAESLCCTTETNNIEKQLYSNKN